MRNPTYLIRSRYHTFYFRYKLPDALQCAVKTPYVKLSLGTCEPKQARQLSRLLEYHVTQAVHHPQVQTLPHSEAMLMLRQYLTQILYRSQSSPIMLQPMVQQGIQQIALPELAELDLPHADISLQAVIERYMEEMQKAGVWGTRAVGQIEDCPGVLTDYMGKDYSIARLGYTQARQVKELLTQPPANRNKKRETRGLQITKQITVQGIFPA